MRSYMMIAVKDVEASSAWYQKLLGATSGHGGPDFEMLMDGGELLLMLHRLDVEEHPSMASPAGGVPGSGVLFYFYVDDVDAAYERARTIGATVADVPHVNRLAHQYEFSLTDPDGYALSVCRYASKEEMGEEPGGGN